jgi:hypothetical protein
MKLWHIGISTSIIVLGGTACNEPSNINQTVQVVMPSSNPAPMATTQPNRPPQVQQFSANPSERVKPNDIVSFTLIAHDPDGDSLSYSWSATKGTLSSNKGLLNTWSPLQADGTPDTGSATISVLIQDERGGTVSAQLQLTLVPQE